MKKIIVLLIIFILSSPCFAGGVGYINYEAVVQNYKFARTTLAEIEARGNEIQKYLSSKEEEYNKIESPLQRQKFEAIVKSELKGKEAAFNEFREKREDEVYNRIHAVAEKIRLEKNLDALLDAQSVFSGGVDITQELIQKLNSNIR